MTTAADCAYPFAAAPTFPRMREKDRMSIKERCSLAGKVAIVTGASKGIGEEIARGLAEFGAKVIVSSRKQEAVDAVVAEFKKQGLEAAGVACHVGDGAARKNLVERTVALFGGVDILVNNAATNPVFGPVVNTDEAVFDKIIGVNLKAPSNYPSSSFPACANVAAVRSSIFPASVGSAPTRCWESTA